MMMIPFSHTIITKKKIFSSFHTPSHDTQTMRAPPPSLPSLKTYCATATVHPLISSPFTSVIPCRPSFQSVLPLFTHNDTIRTAPPPPPLILALLLLLRPRHRFPSSYLRLDGLIGLVWHHLAGPVCSIYLFFFHFLSWVVIFYLQKNHKVRTEHV